MEPLFYALTACRGVEQSPQHHPEGDVLTHSLQVARYAFRESIDTDLILAALLHDIGKHINARGHDRLGAEFVRAHVSAKTEWLIEQHMRVWYLILGQMRRHQKIRDLLDHPWLPELIHLARWDKMGRNPAARVQYDEDDIMARLNACAEKRFLRLTADTPLTTFEKRA